jgi:hypothetical protein
MPIVSADIDFRLSGGAANSDPNASLGGAKSSTEITAASLHNLFDQVASAESSAGDVEYRCFYVHNAHATLALQNAVIWVQTNTPASDTTVDIGLGASAVNGTEQTVANESTAPSGVTFSAPATEGAALSIGNIPAGQHKAVWVRRTISAAAAANNLDNVVLRVKGDTAA